MAYKSISEQAEDSLIESAKEIDKQIQSMTKKVDLARIPKWEVGKWYYFEIALEWVSLVTYTKKESYNYPMIVSVSNRDYTRAFTHSGLHALEDKTRTLLEPWEAAILYPECKETAPDGVDWSEPETSEPNGMPTPEASPLPENLFEQNRALLARNSELKDEVQKLNIMLETERAGIVENFKEKTRLAEENEKLTTQMKDRNIKVQALSESANELSFDLTQAQILIGKLALKLHNAGEL